MRGNHLKQMHNLLLCHPRYGGGEVFITLLPFGGYWAGGGKGTSEDDYVPKEQKVIQLDQSSAKWRCDLWRVGDFEQRQI